ncbi:MULTISPECIES: TIR domain-containing protein [Burkholderiaceae]|jgi:predicted nucleotide-binding protein|uniref:TIR domain-containing protein n=1 Tax=Burkholderiaceae TaxID=119060 RepID=UPI000CEDD78B|nr:MULTISPECIES: nucleotide-binding protein [Burkholderiaceae]MBN6205578.1 nucleotide-binding protein [Ralstonia pickettii]MBU9580754.1 nucleotide-binding protein [Ralstonia mannitolilytica]MCM3609026.1 nucleotide-binding protein [Cupriavidus pauculus]
MIMTRKSVEAIQRGIHRLSEQIEELHNFEAEAATTGNPPALAALQARVVDTLERVFGRDTSAFRRFQGAAHLVVPSQGSSFFSARSPSDYYPAELSKNLERSVRLLEAAQDVLHKDLEDARYDTLFNSEAAAPQKQTLSRRVFVVHGHDGEAREIVARFLKTIEFEPVILHEQPNQGRTVIEKVEANSDVGFAVVLLTADDLGRSVKGEQLEPRARQNVLLELGYFIGKLTRVKVCALKRGELEIPSDFAGIVWEKMDDGNGWKMALARELKAAGYAVDLNKAL